MLEKIKFKFNGSHLSDPQEGPSFFSYINIFKKWVAVLVISIRSAKIPKSGHVNLRIYSQPRGPMLLLFCIIFIFKELRHRAQFFVSFNSS